MDKYTIEGNINFYDELFKSLDEDTDDEEELCQITGLHLTEKFVTLECKHKFNYTALYKEIYKQKYHFKTYDIQSLSRKDQFKMRISNMDYFIKCPYCRNIQFMVLPYYEELGLEKKYGINTNDIAFREVTPSTIGSRYGSDDFTFTAYNVTFKKGICCFSEHCQNHWSGKYVANVPNTQMNYCKGHYKIGLKQHLIFEKEKLLEEMNMERVKKGLPLLKRLVTKKKKTENVVHTTQTISTYVPDIEPLISGVVVGTGCKAILKTGPNKGKHCGCTKLFSENLCKRHSQCLKDITNSDIIKK